MAMNPRFCKVREFKPKSESILTYLKKVSLLFEVNEIAKDKQVTWLLNMLGAKIYFLVRTLFVSADPQSKSMEEPTQVLKHHFEPKCLMIARKLLL